MSSEASALSAVGTKEFTIYFGVPILIIGVIGGVLNIIVFLSLKTFGQSACTFYLTIMSFVNIGQLIANLLSRIMMTGWGLHFTDSSPVYCKFRYYYLQVCGLTSYSCMCLATIDQFLATSRRHQWQQFLTIRRARFSSMLFCLVWLLHGIPAIIFFYPVASPRTGTISCSFTNEIFQKYYTYFYTLTLMGLIPTSITVLFGCLAYRNVRQIPYRAVPLARRELDKQLTSMVLVQVVYNFIVMAPYISVQIILYTANFHIQSPNYIQLLSGIRITGLLYYLYFAVS